MLNPKSILIYSYYSNMPGVCQAEWVDDRMFAFIKAGYDASLISATSCKKHTQKKIEHIRVPALSPYGAQLEYGMIKRYHIRLPAITRWYIRIMASLAPFFEKIKLKSGEGRWTWVIAALVASFKLRSIRNKEFIFSTGGPPSAHLAGILIAKIFRKKIICEFQDPLSGKDIGRNRLSQAGLRFFEKIIIKHADCTLYCTKNAMLYARGQYRRHAHKIHFVYPGSHKITNDATTIADYTGKKIRITYLGSLYQTRNMDSMMKAIGEMIIEDKSVLEKIEVHIYGNMNPDIKERIESFPFPVLHIQGFVDRETAIRKAMEADILLLIQNTDDRSITTIPFKTYDYLHTGKLVLGLVYKNEELGQMLLKYGHIVCQADDVPAIKKNLLQLLSDPARHFMGTKPSDLTPDLAVSEMLNLLDKLPFLPDQVV